MKFKLLESIFTDKSKEWEPLINRTWQPFFMLHLRVIWLEETDKELWVSKYYTRDESLKLKEKLIDGKIYSIEVRQSWIYFNIQNVMNDQNEIII